jgi:ribosomal protein S27AE
MTPPDPTTRNCPSCGAATPPLLRHSKLAVCGYCNSTLFIEDEQVAGAGEKSILADIPSILSFGHKFHLGNWIFEPVGRIRYEYGDSEGVWDEWWVQLTSGKMNWISNDEGEYINETEVKLEGDAPPFEAFKIGAAATMFGEKLRVTEINEATCIGVEGQLPEVIRKGDKHRYAHLEGPKGLMVTAEYEEDVATFYKGVWLDPFEIKIA